MMQMTKRKNIAPEPYLNGALHLLYHASLYIRNHANTISAEQLSDLGDALHNVPSSIYNYGEYFDEATIREIYLSAYDRKWSDNEPWTFSLLRTLDAGMAKG